MLRRNPWMRFRYAQLFCHTLYDQPRHTGIGATCDATAHTDGLNPPLFIHS